ncbi:MAG TPA: hypothetical protein VGF07_02045 [Stellaceae bacterium]|jgi:hypothetical protein
MAAKIGRARLVQRQRAAQKLTSPTSLPPPLKGWNARDPFEAMDPQDAITLDNWYPDYGGCRSRDGCAVYAATDSASPVPTLAVWRHGSPSALVAASGSQLWDVSGGIATKAVVIGSDYQSDWWASANFNGYLFLVNGIDPPQQWQGPASGDAVAAGFTLDPAAGFDPSYINALNGIAVKHNRLFFWTGRDPGFWYGPLLGIAGTLSYFPFDQLVPDGAALVAVETLTYDGGTGIADYTVFILSTGEMLSYSGTDPSNPDNWALVGLYVIAAPVGGAEVSGENAYPNRGTLRYGGDVYVITSSDHAKMSQLITALKLGQMPPRSKASQAVADAVALGRTLPGWQVIYWGYKRRLVFNVPQPDGTFQQHLYNPALDAWSRYVGIPAITWCVWGDRLFFGTPQGMICEHGVGSSDQFYWYRVPWNTTPWNSSRWSQQVENPINATAQQAWNLFGTPLEKRVAAVRPVIQSIGAADFNFSLGFDYGKPSVTITVNQANLRSPWNTSPWNTSPWSDTATVDALWHVASGDGSAVSLMVGAAGVQPLTWVRTDLRLEPGQAL